MRPTAVDLFAGAGGLALGFEQAGFDVVAAYDNDPVHTAVHSYNFPQTEVRCRDLSVVRAEEVLEAAKRGHVAHGRPESGWSGGIDVIIGGPPCQGISQIGKRDIEDERNELIFDFARLVREIRPQAFLLENVPGLVRGEYPALLEKLIESFEDAGYRVRQPVEMLNAADFGVPQDRERVFVLGARRDQSIPAYPSPTVSPRPKRPKQPGLFESNGNGSLPPGPSVEDAIGDLPNIDEYDELLSRDWVELSEDVLDWMEETASDYAKRLRGTADDPSNLAYPRRFDRRKLTSSKRTDHMEKSIRRFLDTEPGTTEPISRFYRLDPRGLCNTLRAGTGRSRGGFTAARPIHPHHPRVISVREAARLHSYPDWFRLHSTKWHGFRQVGNSVPPLLGRALATEVRDALRVSPTRPGEVIDTGSEELLTLGPNAAAAEMGAAEEEIPGTRSRGA